MFVLQDSKKVPSGRPGQVDFCVGQVTFPTHLLEGQGYGQAARELQYRSRVTYHLSSREKRDASREKRESLNRGVWNILLARSQCTLAN